MLPSLSPQQPIAGTEPPNRLYYQYFKLLGDLAIRALFESLGLRAKVAETAQSAQEAEGLALQALLLSLARRDGEFMERISVLSSQVALLQQQNIQFQQQAQLREAEQREQANTSASQFVIQIQQASNRAWQFEQKIQNIEDATLTTSDVAEGSNLYFTASRARSAVLGAYTGGTDVPTIGYVTMNDSSGTPRKFAIIA